MVQTPSQKRPFFWGGVCTIRYFFNFGDTTPIQNMENIKSKFLIDLKYFSQHLVNTNRFNQKWNLRILEKVQKMHCFEYRKFSNPFNSKSGRIFNEQCVLRSFGTSWTVLLKGVIFFPPAGAKWAHFAPGFQFELSQRV